MRYHIVHDGEIVASGPARKILPLLKKYKKVQYPVNVFRVMSDSQLKKIGIYREVCSNPAVRKDNFKIVSGETVKYDPNRDEVVCTLKAANKPVAKVREMYYGRVREIRNKILSGAVSATMPDGKSYMLRLSSLPIFEAICFTARIHATAGHPEVTVKYRDTVNRVTHELSSGYILELRDIFLSKIQSVYEYSWDMEDRVKASSLAQLKKLDVSEGWPSLD